MAAGATSVYLVAASACPTDLFGQLRNALGACCGGEAAVLTPECIERSARAELGEEEAAHVLGARRLSAIDGAELVVAELSGADASVGAEVMYALHRRRVAVLCLWRRGEGGAFAAGLPEHPLLTAHEYADADAATALVEAFATPPEQPGRIFVVEGGDGAGKQTQSAMMRERLRAEGYPVSTLDYPHDAAQHGQLIRTLLSGAKGDLKALNPLLFASLYAENRHDTGPLLRAWLRRGDNVVLDRYVEANFGHQASKLPPDERPALIAQLAEVRPHLT
jgi:dTMP kinase